MRRRGSGTATAGTWPGRGGPAEGRQARLGRGTHRSHTRAPRRTFGKHHVQAAYAGVGHIHGRTGRTIPAALACRPPTCARSWRMWAPLTLHRHHRDTGREGRVRRRRPYQLVDRHPGRHDGWHRVLSAGLGPAAALRVKHGLTRDRHIVLAQVGDRHEVRRFHHVPPSSPAMNLTWRWWPRA